MKYFTIKELSSSTTATSKKINNTPNLEVIDALTLLIEHILDPLREKYGKPIKVNSGYRSPELNKAIGGSKTSDHMNGRAADITAGSKAENKKLFDLIKANFKFDQLIDESDYTWVHVSFRAENNRNLVLKM